MSTENREDSKNFPDFEKNEENSVKLEGDHENSVQCKMQEVLTIERFDDNSKTLVKNFKSSTNLNEIPEIEKTCTICSQSLNSFTHAQSHYKTAHNQNGFLMCCNRKFFQNSQFKNHLELHKNPEKFQCDICSKNLTSKLNLQAHLALHSERVEFSCDLCDRKVTTKYRLTAHMRENHKKKHKEENLKNFSCEICGKKLKNSISLKEHQKSFHTESERIECEICGHFLKNRLSMRKHKNRHLQMQQNIKCEICGKACTTKAALRSHMRGKRATN